MKNNEINKPVNMSRILKNVLFCNNPMIISYHQAKTKIAYKNMTNK